MIKKVYLENLYFVLLLFYIFFNLIFKVQSYAIWGLTFLLIIIEIVSHDKLIFKTNRLLFVILALLMMIGAFISPRTGEAIKFTASFACLIIMFIVLSGKENDGKLIYTLTLIFSGVHVFATLFYQLFPSIWIKILPFFLKGNDLANNIYVFNIQHINCGLSPVQSANAMYITAFIMCVFSKALKTKKVGYWFLTITGFIALMLTSKRGVTLAVILSFILTYFIYNSKTKNAKIITIVKIFFIGILALVTGYFIAKNYFPDALRIIDRFTNQTDITTGRNEIYTTLFNRYKNGNIFVGNGLFSSREILYSTFGESNDAHNIYLQVLVELGIPGIVCILAILISSFVRIAKMDLKKDPQIKVMAIFYTLVFFIYGISGNGLFDLSIAPMWLLMLSFIFNENSAKEVE